MIRARSSGTPGPPHRAGAERVVALTGTFDVRNYGDLLFPLIAAERLEGAGIKVMAISPTGKSTGWADTAPVHPLQETLFGPDRLDGILIGGGNIIHADPVDLRAYVDAGVAGWAYPSLWLGATCAAAMRGIPIAWNAPGVPAPMKDEVGPMTAAVLKAASYVSVRDITSAENLGIDGLRVVPDTALGIARLWPRKSLDSGFKALVQQSGLPSGSRFVAIHPKKRSLRGSAEELAVKIEKFCGSTGLIPIVIGIGACHGDDAIAAQIVAALDQPAMDLSRPRGLREIAAALACSQLYVGASMHGYITAAAYGRHGIIVGKPKLAKMAGLLLHLGRAGDEAQDWDQAFGKARLRLNQGPKEVPQNIASALDVHWSTVSASLLTNMTKKHPSELSSHV